MSLIQEALKRQQEEMSRQNDGKADGLSPEAAPTPPAPPSPEPTTETAPILSIKKKTEPVPVPSPPKQNDGIIITPLSAIPGPPLAQAPTQPPEEPTPPPPALPKKADINTRKSQPPRKPGPKKEKSSKTPQVVVLVLLLLVLVGFGARYGAQYLAKQTKKPLGAVVAEIPAKLQKALTQTSESDDTQPSSPNEKVPPPPPPGSTSGAPGDEIEKADIEVPDQMTDPGPAGPKQISTPEAPKSWPHMKLTAIVGRGKNGSAMLNGKVLATGDVIEHVSVMAIRSDGVELQFNGETRFLRTGAHIE